jgi:peptide deformylase
MAVREILLLGDPRLHQLCEPVRRDELRSLAGVVEDLHDTLFAFRARWNAGRAIAAPQIGVPKRLVYMHVGEPAIFINPVLEPIGAETFELWDDCMSFPELLVKVERHRRVRIGWRDLEWKEQSRELVGDLSELLQHECDHLDGILATSRAVDPRAFALRRQLEREKPPE